MPDPTSNSNTARNEEKNTLQDIRNLESEVLSIRTENIKQAQRLVNINNGLEKSSEQQVDYMRMHYKVHTQFMKDKEKELEIQRKIYLSSGGLLKHGEKISTMFKSIVSQAGKLDFGEMLRQLRSAQYWGNLLKENLISVGPELVAAGYLVKQIWKVFKSWDEVTTDLRKTFGGYRTDFKSFSEFVSATVSGHRTYFNQTLDFVVSLSKEFGHLGVSMSVVGSAISGMVDSLGSSLFLSRDLVKQASLMQASFGIAAGTTSAFLLNMSALNGSTMESNRNLVGIAQSMSQTAGVPLAEIMGDVAHASGQAYTFLSRNPVAILKTVTALRTMGTSLENAVQSSSSILDFTNSVNSEMEASVLLGRSINLQRARELAYRKDLVGEQKELTRILQSVDFANRDRFSQEATARAMGLSVDQAMKLLSTQQQLNHARRDPALQAQVKAYDQLMKSTDAQLKASGKNNQKLLETLSNQTRMASISDKFSRIMTKLGTVFLPIIDVVLGFIADHLDGILGIGASIYAGWKIFRVVSKNIESIWGVIGKTIRFVGTAFRALIPLGGRFLGFIRGIGLGLSRVGGLFARILNPLGKIVGAFLAGWYIGKLINKLKFVQDSVTWFFLKMIEGWNATVKFAGKAWDSIVSFIKGWWKEMKIGAVEAWSYVKSVSAEVWAYISDAGSKAWKAISGFAVEAWDIISYGLRETGKAIFHILADPFVEVYKFVLSFFGGNSPSQLGLSIVNGISSIGGMLLDSITAPFRTAWSTLSGFGVEAMKAFDPLYSIGSNILKSIVSVGPALFSALTIPFRMLMSWIDKVPLIGGILNKMGLGTEVPGPKSIEKKAQAAYIPAVTVSPTGTKIESRKEEKPGEKPKGTKEEPSGKTIDDLYNVMYSILTDLRGGKLGASVNLDSQLVSVQMARLGEFRGGYGVNKVS